MSAELLTSKERCCIMAGSSFAEGFAWADHNACLFCGTERFFRPMYAANLIESWLPALDGVTAKLASGAKVADVGCGHGSSTILMAQTFPNSTFHGFDFHEASIEHARRLRGLRKSAWPSALRRVRSGSRRCSVKAASPGSVGPPRRRPTWCLRPDPNIRRGGRRAGPQLV